MAAAEPGREAHARSGAKKFRGRSSLATPPGALRTTTARTSRSAAAAHQTGGQPMNPAKPTIPPPLTIIAARYAHTRSPLAAPLTSYRTNATVWPSMAMSCVAEARVNRKRIVQNAGPGCAASKAGCRASRMAMTTRQPAIHFRRSP